ncbi:hypothetical protein N2W54_002036 [Lotmaria passim]
MRQLACRGCHCGGGGGDRGGAGIAAVVRAARSLVGGFTEHRHAGDGVEAGDVLILRTERETAGATATTLLLLRRPAQQQPLKTAARGGLSPLPTFTPPCQAPAAAQPREWTCVTNDVTMNLVRRRPARGGGQQPGRDAFATGPHTHRRRTAIEGALRRGCAAHRVRVGRRCCRRSSHRR